jgi:enoyl-CoA hydratase
MEFNNVSMEETVISERKGKILYITLNRPSRGNSLNPPTLVELLSLFKSAQSNPKIKIIHLTGSGEKDFCTGIDLDSARDLSAEAKTNIANVAGDIATLIYHGKPTVVAINGRLMGMGVVFSTAADYRYVVSTAEMRMPEVNFGAFPGASCIALMTRVCGVAWTRRILMTGEPFTVNQLLEAKIADEIVEPEELSKKSIDMAKSYSRKNPVLLQLIKTSIINSPEMPYKEIIELESNFANYYQWKESEEQLKQHKKDFSIEYELTGKPEELIEEYNKWITTLKKE